MSMLAWPSLVSSHVLVVKENLRYKAVMYTAIESTRTVMYIAIESTGL